jgi:hypothetical protein
MFRREGRPLAVKTCPSGAYRGRLSAVVAAMPVSVVTGPATRTGAATAGLR